MINNHKNLGASIPIPQEKPGYSPNPLKKPNKKKKLNVAKQDPVKRPREFPGEKPGEKKQKTIVHKLKPIAPLALYLLFFFSGLFLVAHSAYLNQVNNQVLQQENKLDNLNNEKDYLKMKILEQKSPERLEKIAVENLNLENPNREEVINIH